MMVFAALIFLLLGLAVGTAMANELQAGERERLRSTNQVLRTQLADERNRHVIRLTPELERIQWDGP